jgi:23S rRNA (cytosine1962-C5)-methyltransferase
VRVTPDALRQIRGGHPWVFDASVTSVGATAAPGDLAVVFDDRRRFAAIGLYDPASPIRVRILHHGEPVPIDDAWFRDRIATAFAQRAMVTSDGRTNAYRVVHGENDGLPWLVIDRYDTTAVIKAYSTAWLPHVRAVVAGLPPELRERVVLRLGRVAHREAPAFDGVALVGALPTEPVPFREAGLSFEADVVRGQKTGHFLDQRENRIRVGQLADDARVLDVFACTGGFSVHAAAGGATAVLSVDQSAPALAMARRNMAGNADRIGGVHHDVAVGDAFAVLAELAAAGRRFDVVVVDPPSFASRRDQSPAALRAYARLTALAVAVIAPGGTLVQASCSSRVSADDFHTTIERAARAAGRPLRVTARTGHPPDHPIGFPEGAYLKALFALVP